MRLVGLGFFVLEGRGDGDGEREGEGVVVGGWRVWGFGLEVLDGALSKSDSESEDAASWEA